MKKDRKIYFLMTAEQWLGVVLLVVLIVGTLVAVKYLKPQAEVDTTWANDSTRTQFIDYQQKQDSMHKEQWKKKYPRDTIAIRMQMFDPNTADSSTLVHLGFKPWQAKNMLKYRAKGGKYRQVEDLKRLYGMRWGIETSFRDLKYTLGLSYLHSKKTEYILQEIFAKLTMYNFAELITSHVVVKQKNRKYPYRINFAAAVHVCRNFFLKNIRKTL